MPFPRAAYPNAHVAHLAPHASILSASRRAHCPPLAVGTWRSLARACPAGGADRHLPAQVPPTARQRAVLLGGRLIDLLGLILAAAGIPLSPLGTIVALDCMPSLLGIGCTESALCCTLVVPVRHSFSSSFR
ncbi:hypothetical protein DFH11DRAFT_1732423 [Phellopilus nigrolimitatus]|nr:hypothetical protein DFH11DRAFT_1732423 [Phellopilus nigrolimitatus]